MIILDDADQMEEETNSHRASTSNIIDNILNKSFQKMIVFYTDQH